MGLVPFIVFMGCMVLAGITLFMSLPLRRGHVFMVTLGYILLYLIMDALTPQFPELKLVPALVFCFGITGFVTYFFVVELRHWFRVEDMCRRQERLDQILRNQGRLDTR